MKNPFVEQTGFIPADPGPFDYLAGALPWEERQSSAAWEEDLPDGEQQNNPFVFDTQSCVTFSILNSLETQMIRLIKEGRVSKEALSFLKAKGYYKNNQVNFSDKFIAILSGTSKNGNTYTKVATTARNLGLIPDVVLPFRSEQTWEDWHNQNQITADMRALGLEFLDFFEIAFEFVLVGNEDKKIDNKELGEITHHLKHAPLNIAIPNPGTHAVLMPSYYNIFDSYAPFYKPGKKNIHYVFKVVLTPKSSALIVTLRVGNRGEEVRKLQRKLGINADGVFGLQTEKAVKQFQLRNGMVADGIVGPRTREMLNKEKSMLEIWMEAITIMEGAKPHRNNPGNIRYVGQKNAVNDGGFCKFNTLEDGRQALKSLLTRAATDQIPHLYRSTMTLLDFYHRYAPANDGNDPVAYAKFVAKRLGVPVDTMIKNLIS